MQYLGGTYLLINWYVIGGTRPLLKGNEFTENLNKWITYKDNDWGMSKYRTAKTQYIFEICEIELSVLKEIFNDLIGIYKSEYQYSEKADFIKDVLESTIFLFSDFIEDVKTEYTWLGDVPYSGCNVYYKNTSYGTERIDFICNEGKSIEYYQQYAKRVLALIDNLDFDKNDTIIPPQKAETKKELEKQPFTNNFDRITQTEIYKHFKAGLVETGYLSEQELNEYLKAAFELKIKPKTLFKIKNAPTKQKVMKVFYEYYKNVAGKPHKKQSQYAALLGDYFEGFNTQNVSTNFNK
jgi:hypothetical protein